MARRQHRRPGRRGGDARALWAGPVTAATVLGGGATATSTGLALADLGAGDDPAAGPRPRARRRTPWPPSRGTPSAPVVEVLSLHDDEVVGEVVVSTIPAAAQTDDVVERCADVPVVFEVVYHPWPTPLAGVGARPRSSGAGRDQVLVTGLDLLVHQAALQFEQFTGLPPPPC